MTATRCRLLAPLLVLPILSAQAEAAPVTSFTDIEFWAGEGESRAALAIDWEGNSPQDHSLAWGYRWDGTTSADEMLLAVIGTDPRLYAKLGELGGFGLAVFGIGYDANDDRAFSLDDETGFDDQGFAYTEPSDGALASDPADLYAEGWFVGGFWQYGIAQGNPYGGGGWMRASGGLSSQILVDGSWHSLAFTPTFSNQAFALNPFAAAATADADFDADGDVDGKDFLAWQGSFGLSSGALAAQGDADGDGVVDSIDLGYWSDQFGFYSVGKITTRKPVAIPEPTSQGLILSILLFLSVMITSTKKGKAS